MMSARPINNDTDISLATGSCRLPKSSSKAGKASSSSSSCSCSAQEVSLGRIYHKPTCFDCSGEMTSQGKNLKVFSKPLSKKCFFEDLRPFTIVCLPKSKNNSLPIEQFPTNASSFRMTLRGTMMEEQSMKKHALYQCINQKEKQQVLRYWCGKNPGPSDRITSRRRPSHAKISKQYLIADFLIICSWNKNHKGNLNMFPLFAYKSYSAPCQTMP